MSHDTVAVACERLENPVLERRQAHVAPVPPMGDAPSEIDRDIPQFEHRHRQITAHVAPHDRPHPRQKLRCAERLDDIVIRTPLERREPLGLGGACRQHDDRHRRPGANSADDVEAVAVGEAEIDHHDIRPVLPRVLLAARGGVGDHDPEAIRLEQHAQNVLNRLVVLEDQDEVHRLGHQLTALGIGAHAAMTVFVSGKVCIASNSPPTATGKCRTKSLPSFRGDVKRSNQTAFTAVARRYGAGGSTPRCRRARIFASSSGALNGLVT